MQEIVVGPNKYKVHLSEDGAEVFINDEARKADLIEVGKNKYHLLIDGQGFKIEVVDADASNPKIKVNGQLYEPTVKNETDLLLERLGMNIKAKRDVKELKAPMPGLVLGFKVEPGSEVAEGDALVVLEAMKMENVLKAPASAKVKALNVNVGEAIEKNTVLITFE